MIYLLFLPSWRTLIRIYSSSSWWTLRINSFSGRRTGIWVNLFSWRATIRINSFFSKVHFVCQKKFSTQNIRPKFLKFYLGGLESESILLLLGGLVSESNLFRLGDDDLRFGLFSGFFGDRSFLAGLDFRLGDRSEFLPIAFQPSCFFRSSSGRSSITDATVGAFSPSNSNSARDFISSQLTSLSIIAMFPKISKITPTKFET